MEYMFITPIRVLEDNYVWLIEQDNQAVVVDPGESEPVLSVLEEKGLDLVQILLTHKHQDHVGGTLDLKNIYPNAVVYGPEETSKYNSISLKENETISIFNRDVHVKHTPGHTEGHISYLMEYYLFSGDALFSAGCGRVFTGDYDAAYQTMKWFRSLPLDTQIYAGHEYTLTNLQFNLSIYPKNNYLHAQKQKVEENNERGIPSYPSSIQREREINLFMMAQSVEEFKRLRDLRDNF